MSPPDSTTRALLEESAWLQRLARRLVSESTLAEDAAQDALVAALERPVASGMPLRRWLAGVLRNLVRQGRRGAARRTARERARPLALESEASDEIAARLELQERLVTHVRALAEPYRTTIALRFLDDLSPREVAARMDVPVKTVHTRVERALAKLREELDREHDGRDAWAALLLPLAHTPVPFPTPTAASVGAGSTVLAPLVAMGTLWKWTCAVAVIALVGLFVVQQRRGPAAREPEASALVERATELAPAQPPARTDPLERAREPVAVEAPPAATPLLLPHEASSAPAARLLAGRVIDVERNGLAGLEVRFEPTSSDLSPAALAREPRTTSGAGGAFELPLPAERGRLLASGGGYATLLSFGLSGEMPPEAPLVVVAPARTYGGIVVDTEDAPVPGVELSVRVTRERANELQPGALAGAVPLVRFTTDAAGRFRVEEVAWVDGVALEADLGGFRRLHQELPPLDDLELRVVLEAPPVAASALAGSVHLADGSPARGAWVSAGRQPTRVLEDGSFVLELEPDEKPTAVRAVLPGYQPARLELAGVSVADRQRLALVLDSPALEISGRVVNAAGEPIARAQVWARGGEPFGMMNRRFGEADFYAQTSVEEVLSSTDGEWSDGRNAETDAEGRFRLHGLLARDYDVLAMDPVTQEIAWLAAVPAGEEHATLVLAGKEPAREVRGRVVDLAGAPVAGALVGVYRKRKLPDGSETLKRADVDFHAVSDEHGAFRFERLCVEGTVLLLNGEVIASEQERALEHEPDLLNVVFEAPAVCHVRVFLSDPTRADTLMLLDANDRTLMLSFLVGSVSLGAEEVGLRNGTSDLLRADESARTLVLEKGGEKERIPIRLKPGEVNELRF